MKILARTETVFLSIWSYRILFSLLVLLSILMLLNFSIFLSEEGISYIIAVALLFIANFIVLKIHVVYFDHQVIRVEGIFNSHLYSVDDFARIEFAQYWWESVYFIRFKDAKRFLIATREMQAMSFGDSENSEKVANHLTEVLQRSL